MATEFKLPELGENIAEGSVVNVLVAEGQVIRAGQSVLELETDKAVFELPCPHAGRVVKLHVRSGDRVTVGAVILTIEAAEGAASAQKPTAPPSRVETELTATEKPSVEASPKPKGGEPPTVETVPPLRAAPIEPAVAQPVEPRAPERPAAAGPAVRRLARELGVDLHGVAGTGPGGRITAEDVQGFVRRLATAAPAAAVTPSGAPALPDFSRWGPIERVPMTAIRRKTAETVSLAWQQVPHVTQLDLADITELEAARRRYAQERPDTPVKVTLTVLVIKAAVAALKAYPQCNASLDVAAGEIILKRYYHIGVAADTEHGLIVPVIRDADRKGVLVLAAELENLARRARERKVTLDDLQGGTFTITNLGGVGGTAFTPIVKYPEVAILGVARGREEVVLREGRIEPRLMLPLCLSYDHRVIDGADAVRFLRKVASVLMSPFEVLLEE